MLDRAQPGNSRFVFYGHLKSGLDPQAAEGHITALLNHLAQLYPDRYPKEFGVTINTLGNQTIGRFKPTLYLLLGAVGMILHRMRQCSEPVARTCNNAQKEFAVRRALGASRFRLIAQLLVESLLLALWERSQDVFLPPLD